MSFIGLAMQAHLRAVRASKVTSTFLPSKARVHFCVCRRALGSVAPPQTYGRRASSFDSIDAIGLTTFERAHQGRWTPPKRAVGRSSLLGSGCNLPRLGLRLDKVQ